MSGVYYNENDKFAAAWLRELMRAGLIPWGDIDTRSIVDVRPNDVRGYSACHWFAGIGGWAYAGRIAGLPDDFPWWSGSCPCQPFSVAGKGLGASDSRHLWPEFHRLIRECRPILCIGEQVACRAGLQWLDGVFDGLEGDRYACGAAVIPACGINAPHKRDRLFWGAVADTASDGRQQRIAPPAAVGYRQEPSASLGRSDRLADAESIGRGGRTDGQDGRRRELAPADCGAGGVGNANGARLSPSEHEDLCGAGWRREWRAALQPSGSFWSDAEWLAGADGKARRVKPGIRLLVNGVSGRVAIRRAAEQGGAALQEEEHWYSRIGALRGFGNAIVPAIAAEFIKAFSAARGVD